MPRLVTRTDLRPHVPAPVNGLTGRIAVLLEDKLRSADREVLRCAYWCQVRQPGVCTASGEISALSGIGSINHNAFSRYLFEHEITHGHCSQPAHPPTPRI